MRTFPTCVHTSLQTQCLSICNQAAFVFFLCLFLSVRSSRPSSLGCSSFVSHIFSAPHPHAPWLLQLLLPLLLFVFFLKYKMYAHWTFIIQCLWMRFACSGVDFFFFFSLEHIFLLSKWSSTFHLPERSDIVVSNVYRKYVSITTTTILPHFALSLSSLLASIVLYSHIISMCIVEFFFHRPCSYSYIAAGCVCMR